MRLKTLVMLGAVLAAVFAVSASSRIQHNRLAVSKSGSGSGTVTGSAPADGSTPINCGTVCSGLYKAVTITLTATPDAGSTFDGWNGVCSGAGTCSIYVSATPESGFTYAVTATFNSSKKYLLSVATAGAGKGTVRSTPAGIVCPGACANGFLAGTSVLLTATPDATAAFTGWAGACTGAQPTCTVTVDEAKSVTATFTPKTFTVTVARTGTGSGTVTSVPAGISCGGRCSADLAGSVHLLATAAAGSTFIGWSGACTGSGGCALTLNGAKSVSAQFADTAAPVVKARASSGKRGKTIRLRYSVTDASGHAKERVTITRDGRALAALSHSLARLLAADFVSWRIPAHLKLGSLRFCVVAVDRAGNQSARSCAGLKIT